MLNWSNPDERYYQHGLDRGVLYRPGQPPVPWNGITGFDEGGDSSPTLYYRDGRIFMADVDASDFSGKLTTLFYPDEFSECLGMSKATTGLYVDNQKPKRFSFAYRTLIGAGGLVDPFGYQIHLVYNAIASVAPLSRKTLGPDASLVEFEFALVCTPVKLSGYRPTAHYVIDTREMSSEKITEVETLLYGLPVYGSGLDIIEPTITDPIPGPGSIGRMPTPSELLALMTP